VLDISLNADDYHFLILELSMLRSEQVYEPVGAYYILHIDSFDRDLNSHISKRMK